MEKTEKVLEYILVVLLIILFSVCALRVLAAPRVDEPERIQTIPVASETNKSLADLILIRVVTYSNGTQERYFILDDGNVYKYPEKLMDAFNYPEEHRINITMQLIQEGRLPKEMRDYNEGVKILKDNRVKIYENKNLICDDVYIEAEKDDYYYVLNMTPKHIFSVGRFFVLPENEEVRDIILDFMDSEQIHPDGEIVRRIPVKSARETYESIDKNEWRIVE